MTVELDCDVAVVGAGAAGLSAARAAASDGAKVIVVDPYQRPGGQYYRQPASSRLHPTPTQSAGRRLIRCALDAGADVRHNTSVWGVSPGQLELVVDGTRPGRLKYTAVVVATGAHERSAALPGWTLPGVFTAGAVQTLLKEQGVAPGNRVVLAGTGPLQLVVAAALVNSGVEVAGVYEATRVVHHGVHRPLSTIRALWRQNGRLNEGTRAVATLLRHRVPVRSGWGVVEILGDETVSGAVVARLDGDWTPTDNSRAQIDCDTVALHFSLVPNVELVSLLGARLVQRPELGGWVPDLDDAMATSIAGVFAAGDGTGIGGVDLSLIEGEIAGHSAAAHTHGKTFSPTSGQQKLLHRERRFQQLYGALFSPRTGLNALATADTVVCRCENVTASAIDAAAAMGATTIGTLKSTTRCGMGPCQGRICGPIVALRHCGGAAVLDAPWTPRPPLTPIPVSMLVGAENG